MFLRSTHPVQLIFCSILILLFASCSDNEEDNNIPPAEQPTQPPVTLVNNNISGTSSAMTNSLFREVVADKPGENIIFSPWSLQTALLMATEGAEAESLVDLEALLRLESTSLESIRNEYNSVYESLTSTSYHPTVTSANALFYDASRLALNDSYSDLIQDYYNAGSENLSFADPSSRDQINEWVSQRTNELVPEILQDPIPSNQLFYLINALYFKSDWMYGYDEEFTVDRDFTKGDGSVIQTPMISDSRMILYAETENLKMADLAFKDSTFSLSFIVPKNEDVFDQSWLDEVNPEGIETLYANLQEEYMSISFPIMNLHFRADLINYIKNLGYTAPFNPQVSDFSGISSEQGPLIALNPVLHEVRLKVDEKGAEGAAVTVVGGVVTSSPPPISFDRPFVLSLRHIPTGVQLFFGLVEEPMP